jgi:glycosyltransferase involved in cell wall biosynthesis
MIRIAQVVEAVEGGCRRHVLDLLTGLDRTRLRQTAIVSPRRQPDIADEIARLAAGEVEVIPWDVGRSISPLPDWSAYRQLARLLRERDFDVVHCHSAKAGFLGRLAARRLRARLLYTPHGLPFTMRVSAPARAAYLLLERLAARHMDRLIAVSPSEAEVAVEARLAPRERISVIENGVAPASPAVTVDRQQKRAELQVDGAATVALSVGALRLQKGYRYLIEAAALLANLQPASVFLIAGEGVDRRELQALIGRFHLTSCVRLLGARSDVPELLAAADLFVMPSLWEAGPYALLEAMAAGVPVVGSRIPGITDWLTEGETGYLFGPAGPRSLADAISRALSDPAEARRRADVAQAMVLQRNSRERWLRDMERLYQEVVENP